MALFIFSSAQVVKPSRERFDDMMAKVPDLESHDGGDTGFLNSYYKGWFTTGAEHRLPFGYSFCLGCFLFCAVSWLSAVRVDMHNTSRIRPRRYNALRTMHWLTYAKKPGYWNSIKPLKVIHFCSSPKVCGIFFSLFLLFVRRRHCVGMRHTPRT